MANGQGRSTDRRGRVIRRLVGLSAARGGRSTACGRARSRVCPRGDESASSPRPPAAASTATAPTRAIPHGGPCSVDSASSSRWRVRQGSRPPRMRQGALAGNVPSRNAAARAFAARIIDRQQTDAAVASEAFRHGAAVDRRPRQPSSADCTSAVPSCRRHQSMALPRASARQAAYSATRSPCSRSSSVVFASSSPRASCSRTRCSGT